MYSLHVEGIACKPSHAQNHSMYQTLRMNTCLYSILNKLTASTLFIVQHLIEKSFLIKNIQKATTVVFQFIRAISSNGILSLSLSERRSNGV